jgi:hypothetical protein
MPSSTRHLEMVKQFLISLELEAGFSLAWWVHVARPYKCVNMVKLQKSGAKVAHKIK